MANLNERTVEQQILDSELVNKLREQFGEEGAEAGMEFVNMEHGEQERVILSITLGRLLHMPKHMIILVSNIMESMARECPIEMTLFTKIIIGAVLANRDAIFGEDLEED